MSGARFPHAFPWAELAALRQFVERAALWAGSDEEQAQLAELMAAIVLARREDGTVGNDPAKARPMERIGIEELVDRHVAAIYEHVDAVEVLVSWVDNAHTIGYAQGAGNTYARKQMAREWVEGLERGDLARRIAREVDALGNDGDNGEDWKGGVPK